MTKITVFCILLSVFMLQAQTIIDISVKGISDEQNDGAQKDRKEAILDAKKQACDKAGLTLSSKTLVKNFQTVYDYVESQAESVLLPGFQVIDIGYVADGTYQVVLTGKLKTLVDEAISVKEIRYAQSLHQRGKYSQCAGILQRYIDTTDEKISEEIKEQAFYCFIRWGYPSNPEESFEMFTSYYPESKYNNTLGPFLAFAQKPLVVFDKKVTVKNADWKKTAFKNDIASYAKEISVYGDTMIIADFAGTPFSLVFSYKMFQSDEEIKEPFAYSYMLTCYNGDIRKNTPKDEKSSMEVFNTFKSFPQSSKKQYTAGRSDIRFGNFKMTDYRLKGQIVSDTGSFEQEMKFTIRQVSF